MEISNLLIPDPHLVFHRAAWILPISSPPIHDGIVVLENGRIVDLGPSRSILQAYIIPDKRSFFIDHGDGVILPCLVNAHTHLELSCLKGQVFPKGNFILWIKDLILAKAKCSQKEIEDGIFSAINELTHTGTGLVGDISNTGNSIPLLRSSSLIGQIFLEAIGFSSQKELENREWIKSLLAHTPVEREGVNLSLAAHAPYTVSVRYLKYLQSRQEDLFGSDEPFSIHLAESPEETDFLLNGSGAIASLLIERGNCDHTWLAPKLTPVQYLFQQGLLKSNTICVHMVQICDEDIELLVKSKSHICICPRSNHYLGVGLPPVEKFLQKNIPVSLGTDSLASNTSLSLWQEMLFLKKSFPSLAGGEILRMATLAGSRALGKPEFGSIEIGKRGLLLFLPIQVNSLEDIEELLILEGEGREITWIF